MAYNDLREFITRLEREKELKRIGVEVDVDLEITEITDRVSKASGPALLFEKPRSAKDGKDYSVPLLINTLGTKRRMELALEVSSLDDVAKRIEDLLAMKPPEGLLDKVRMLPKLAEFGSFFPKTVKSGPVKEVVQREDVSLAELPIMQCWPQDGGRFITWPMVVTRSPKNGRRNVGCYRMQVFDERTTGMHWQIHKTGAEHFRWLDRQGKGRRMDVAVAIGADPLTMLAGILPLPEDLDEFLFAGFLRQKPVELVRCETVDLDVPAHAEIVLEGYVDLDDIRVEGPFGDHTGYYSLAGQFPGLSPHLHHPPQESDLRFHHRRPSAHGRLLDGLCGGASVPSADAPADAGSGGHAHAAPGRVPQPDHRLHPQELSGARPQGDERHLGIAGRHVLQVHRGGG